MTAMTIAIDLTREESDRLADAARRCGLSPEEFARRVVVESLDRDNAVAAAARYVLGKNAELYRRLAK